MVIFYDECVHVYVCLSYIARVRMAAGQISASEFMAFLRSSGKINPLWLSRTLTQQPCVVYNAALHYNHTYVCANLHAPASSMYVRTDRT